MYLESFEKGERHTQTYMVHGLGVKLTFRNFVKRRAKGRRTLAVCIIVAIHIHMSIYVYTSGVVLKVPKEGPLGIHLRFRLQGGLIKGDHNINGRPSGHFGNKLLKKNIHS